MDFKTILGLLQEENNPTKSYSMLETLVLRVLTRYLKDQNKELLPNYRSKQEMFFVEFDGFAPDGFDNFEGPTILEIKFYRNKNSLYRFGNIFERLTSSAVKSGLNITNIILIVTLDLSDKDKYRFLNQFENNHNMNIVIWDINDLTKILNLYSELVGQIYENISELLIDTKISESVKKSNDDWKIKQRNGIEQLRRAYEVDDLVLFLGAGVSMDAKISSWDDLVNDLLVNLISNKLIDYDINLSEEEKNFIVINLKNSNGNSPLLIARYIRKGLENVFNQILTQILYKNCINTSDILKEIAQLCLPIRDGIGVRGVVTYNFDDLLEYNLRDFRIRFKSVFRESDIPSSSELGIYHVC